MEKLFQADISALIIAKIQNVTDATYEIHIIRVRQYTMKSHLT